jgi:hypothetical protein
MRSRDTTITRLSLGYVSHRQAVQVVDYKLKEAA